MAVVIDEDKINSMSVEEMQKLEDQIVAEEAGVVTPDPVAESVPAAVTPPTETPATGNPAPAEPAAATVPATPAPTVPAVSQQDEELRQHISPPSKWAAERHAKKQLQRDLEETKAKAEKAEVLEGELGKLREELNHLRTAVTQGGIKLPGSPADPAAALTPEKIEEIRLEFGNELADMMSATAAILKAQAKPAQAAAPAPAAQVQPAPAQTSAQPTVDPALLEAIDNNDDLSYWRENSQALWSRAVAKDQSLINDPAYQQLSYQDRFAKVVELVKNDIVQGTGKPTVTAGETPPATSLTGAPGVPAQTNVSSALDQMQAIEDPAKQMVFYNSLPAAKRDEIDKALGI